MFKAVSPYKNTPLDLFQASLETARVGEALPDQLKRYVCSIMREAGSLQTGDGDVATMHAASIHLSASVSESLQWSALAQAIEGSGITRVIAERVLSAMRATCD